MVTRGEILWCPMFKVNVSAFVRERRRARLGWALLVVMSVAMLSAQDGGRQPAADGSQPVARADENSRLAHRQLVEKARRGGIDVYFAGDSITRRWGTSDVAYRQFLDNWTRNFFGWNAANFGWGGDTVQNVLWRLTEGELDGVHPKVIVIMAGTNNVGATPRDGVDAMVVGSGVLFCGATVPSSKAIVTVASARLPMRI